MFTDYISHLCRK